MDRVNETQLQVSEHLKYIARFLKSWLKLFYIQISLNNIFSWCNQIKYDDIYRLDFVDRVREKKL